MANFLGQGWRFPVRVNASGGLDWARETDAIEQSICLILATPKRGRIMKPTFGCAIHDYVFAPNNAATRAQIASEVRGALVQWEPRIDVLNVTSRSEPGAGNVLLLSIDYRIRANNAARNVVYPFHLQEGAA